MITIEASERLERLLERAEAWKDMADLLRTRVWVEASPATTSNCIVA